MLRSSVVRRKIPRNARGRRCFVERRNQQLLPRLSGSTSTRNIGSITERTFKHPPVIRANDDTARVLLSTKASSSSSSSSSSSQFYGGEAMIPSSSAPGDWLLGLTTTVAALAMALGSSVVLLPQNEKCRSTVQCETSEQRSTEPPTTPEEDPYENLPEEDEETDCSMCNTFRKGPCRPYWRKLERCFKDHEKEENGAIKCMPYFQPHQTCLMEYTNLYKLVSLELKQDLVRDAELSILEHERREWDPPVDWGIWKQFVGEAGIYFKETIRKKEEGSSDLLPLWRRLPENKEPVLLTITAALPRVDEKSGMILKIAYAVDQDGFVVGLTYNDQYGELVEQTQGGADKSSSSSEKQPPPAATDSGKDEASPGGIKKVESLGDNQGDPSEKTDGPFGFDFFVLPGETKTVQICGLYSENPVTASPDKQILDALLFKSGKQVLKDIAQRP